LFAEACRNAPSLLLLDEVDALCPRQRSSQNDVEQRVVACMCSQLDAIVSRHSDSMVQSILFFDLDAVPSCFYALGLVMERHLGRVAPSILNLSSP